MAVQKWIDGMARSAAKTSLSVLRRTLDHAVMLDILQSNPAAKNFSLPDGQRRESAPFSPEELRLIADAVRGTCCEVPFILSAGAGLRIGEACAVKVADVERTDGGALVRVEQQLSQDGVVSSRLKTKGSRRVAGLPEPWASALFAAMEELPPGSVWTNDDGTGSPVPRRMISYAWDCAIARCGVKHRPMQALRPTFETRMHWAGGMPIEKVARAMGHSSMKTTLDHYDRPGVEAAHAVIEAGSKMSET